MPGSNTAPFLQALGWATLNSIWQMAFTWLLFLLFTHFFRLSSFHRYLLAVGGVLVGFAWFLYTFCAFYFFGNGAPDAVTSLLPPSGLLLPAILSSASLTYLVLLILPTFQLVRNWQFIRKIKREGMQKISYQNRLFVEKYSRYLGIGRNVQVYLSSMVSSPVTLGFLKPLILLPISVATNLTPVQVEAILLHELSHIRRHDYLVNLLLSIIHVILYFNPFVKLFLQKVEWERENCCDEMVLQFEYDKVSYASALLQLEKNSRLLHLAMAAANKNNLLHRIETIVGKKRSQQVRTIEMGGILAGLLMFLLINSFLFHKGNGVPADFGGTALVQPSAFFVDGAGGGNIPAAVSNGPMIARSIPPLQIERIVPGTRTFPAPEGVVPWEPAAWYPEVNNLLHVSFEDDKQETLLDEDQKEQVKETVARTKKVLELQWKDVDNEIADGMTLEEKRNAKREYLAEIERIDWKKVETKLAKDYDEIDWNRVNGNVSEVMDQAKLDSVEACYKKVIQVIEKSRDALITPLLPIPDVSEQQVKQARTSLKNNLKEFQKVRTKKIVRL